MLPSHIPPNDSILSRTAVKLGSLCDQCRRPGACCFGFVLGSGPLRDGPALVVDELLSDIVTCTREDGSGSFVFGQGGDDHERARADPNLANVLHGLPFRRLSRAADGAWRYWCPRLGADGRCTKYETRPAVCRALAPATATPCCHYVAKIGVCLEREVDHSGSRVIFPSRAQGAVAA